MEFDYSSWQVGFILGAYLIAALTKGITGLGFTTTSLPILTMVLGLKEALPLVIIPSIASNLVVMVGAGRFSETVQRFWPMLAVTVPGLVIGLWVLSWIDGRLAGGVLGVMLLVWCVFSLAKPELDLPPALERPLGLISGFLTGLINGMTGSQVIPSVPYLMMLRLDRDLFLQAINCSFTMSSLIMAVGLNRLGLFTVDALILSGIGAVLILTGVKAGERIRHRLSPERFRMAVTAVLIVMSMGLISQLV